MKGQHQINEKLHREAAGGMSPERTEDGCDPGPDPGPDPGCECFSLRLLSLLLLCIKLQR